MKDKNSERRAGRINQHIPYFTAAAGDEVLVNLIRYREDCRESPCGRERAERRVQPVHYRNSAQKAEQSIYREMHALTHEKLKRVNARHLLRGGGFREGNIKKREKTADEKTAGGRGIRSILRRKKKNNQHTGECGERKQECTDVF